MSKLVFGTEQVIEFEGSSTATLGLAIAYLTQSANEFRYRILSGQVEAVPECILDLHRRTEDHARDGQPVHRYTIVPLPESGYRIWVAGGPDLYQLID